MSFLKKWTSWLLIFAVLGLMMYPFTVQSGDPYRIEHQSKQGNVTSGHEQDLRMRILERQYQAAKREAQSATDERYRAYLPTSPLFESTRQNRILRAESDLDRANTQLKSIENRIYLDKRIQESEARDRKIEQMRR